jgi:hypothetical protein
MSKFCDILPADVLRYIFQFLKVEDICSLDIAMTNMNDREIFRFALDGIEIPMMISSSKKTRFEDEILWCLSRGVVLKSLWLEYDYPDLLSQLIVRNPLKLNYVHVFNLSYVGAQLISNICQCSNLVSLAFMSCGIIDSDLDVCLGPLNRLRELKLSTAPKLTSAFIRSIIHHRPKLECLNISEIPCVSDDELKEILEGLPCLTRLFISEVNFTDRSMNLLVEANRNQEIVYWKNCPRVTWEGKLSYLRQLHLPEIFSENVKQQLSGIKGFAEMIPYQPTQFPIEEYISMGIFSQVEVILSSIEQSNVPEMITTVFMFSKLIAGKHINRLIEIGFVDFMMRGINLTTHGASRDFINKEWLNCFNQICQNSYFCRLLIWKGILPKLMTLPLVRNIHSDFSCSPSHPLSPLQISRRYYDPHLLVFEIIDKLSNEVDHWNSAPAFARARAIDEEWIRLIPFLIEILRHPQDDPHRIKVSSLIHKITLKITDPTQLEHVVCHIRGIDTSILPSEALNDLERLVQINESGEHEKRKLGSFVHQCSAVIVLLLALMWCVSGTTSE